LAEIACGDFSGHYSVGRRQKAWFLPATSPTIPGWQKPRFLPAAKRIAAPIGFIWLKSLAAISADITS
jgi:hypothetical protein